MNFGLQVTSSNRRVIDVIIQNYVISNIFEFLSLFRLRPNMVSTREGLLNEPIEILIAFQNHQWWWKEI